MSGTASACQTAKSDHCSTACVAVRNAAPSGERRSARCPHRLRKSGNSAAPTDGLVGISAAELRANARRRASSGPIRLEGCGIRGVTFHGSAILPGTRPVADVHIRLAVSFGRTPAASPRGSVPRAACNPIFSSDRGRIAQTARPGTISSPAGEYALRAILNADEALQNLIHRFTAAPKLSRSECPNPE